MTNHYNKRGHSPDERADADELLSNIQRFLSRCHRPAVLEPGDTVLGLEPGEYSCEVRGNRLQLSVCSSERNLSRRIVSIDYEKPGLMTCTVQRFAG